MSVATMQPMEPGALPATTKLHSLRQDLAHVQAEGLVGNVLFWWLGPVKCVMDPVLDAVEHVVPPMVSHVQGSDQVLNVGLNLVETLAHGAYGIAHGAGVVTSANDPKETYKALSHYLSLVEQSPALDEDQKEQVLQQADAMAGKFWFLKGLHPKTFSPLSALPESALSMVWEGYGALYTNALQQHTFGEERPMSSGLQYAETKALLAKIQQIDLDQRGWSRCDEMLSFNEPAALEDVLQQFTLAEARRFCKFALAAYGDSCIQSTSVDTEQSFDWRKGALTKELLSDYTGIPTDDLILFDGGYYGDQRHLRHFVAVDRKNRKVILAIRGTYTHDDTMTDLNGYSREFLGAQAHAGISIMTELVWDNVSVKVLELLDKHIGFEFIVTGHSLGAGSTCLLNLMLHRDTRMRRRRFRCFAFGAPPVFAPAPSSVVAATNAIGTAPNVFDKECLTCVNFINQYDGIPFLSVDSVRHQMAMIATVDTVMTNPAQRAKVLLGWEKPDAELVQQIHDIQRNPLPASKPAIAQSMCVPAVGNVWLWPDPSKENAFKPFLADSLKMAETGIFIHKNDLTDHLPANYDLVLKHAEQ